MATSSRTIAAPPARVFDVLRNGWMYSNWVVGTSHMRAVDPDWPALGSKLLHASGAWPVVLRDETEVVAVEPDRSLTVIARGRPLGEARITLELHPVAGTTRVEMTEVPIAGPGKWLWNPVVDALTVRRNVESLARLAAIAERHEP